MLARSSRRHLARHPALAALAALGVALGVAVVVAVDLANASTTRAFALSAEAVGGRATHEVVGGPGGLEAEVYRRLVVEEGVADVAPVVQGYARSAADSSRVFEVLGVDPFAEAAVRPWLGPQAGVDLPALFVVPGAVLISEGTAADLGVEVGGTFPLRIEGRPVAALVVGVLAPEDERSRSALADLLVVDVATAQEWLGMAGPGVAGALSRIDLVVPDGPAGEALLSRVEAGLPEGVEVRPAQARADALDKMTAAFRTNLAALSLLALVVGVFLIYNTITFSVVQRRRLVGTYRALGVTRREVFLLILAEAAAVGFVGTVLGLVLGVGLGQGLVRLVTGTISDLYFVVRVREAAPGGFSLFKGALLGMGATLAAALLPAWEAASAPPTTTLRRSSEEDRLAGRAGRLALVGLVLALAGAGVLVLPGGIALAYGGLLLVIAGAALAAPWATRVWAGLVAPLAGRAFGPVGTMAARGLSSSLSRTAVAAAALAVAVSATVGVGVMVRAFRGTVVEWLEGALQADVFVAPPSLVFRRGGGTLDPALAREIAALPGVVAAYPIRVRPVEVGGDGATADLFAASFRERDRLGYRLKEGDPEAALVAVGERGAVLVSEPFAYRFGVGAGDRVVLGTARGPRAFPIAGIHYDYGSDLGVVVMDFSTYRPAFADASITGLGLYAAEGVDPETIVSQVRSAAAGRQAVEARSNRALREASIALFDRTFLVTTVLRLLAIGVAFVGVLSALMALQLERQRELAVLRAQGMTQGEVRRSVLIQTGLLGLWAGLLALPLGLLLAVVLVYVINRRSFGWTLRFEWAPDLLVQAVGLALVAALLAGLYPAWRMARADPALAMREEG